MLEKLFPDPYLKIQNWAYNERHDTFQHFLNHSEEYSPLNIK